MMEGQGQKEILHGTVMSHTELFFCTIAMIHIAISNSC